MTKRVVGPPRPSYHQRRREREEFRQLKARVDANPSPELTAYRERNRRGAHANLARRKIAHKRSDPLAPIRRLTPSQFAAIRPGLQDEARRLGLAPLPDVSDLF